MENIFIEFLPPWVETGLQPAFYDKESGSILQQVSRMYYKMNEIIKNVNKQNEAIEEYIEKFIELKNYVDDYFDNLDVQEEINNKLDDMAEDGELAEIIAVYLNSNAIMSYNTVSNLSDAENLVAGSFAKTYGKDTLGDHYGAFYKVRAIINTDVPDGYNLVALTNSPTLVAERVINIEEITSSIAVLTYDTEASLIADTTLTSGKVCRTLGKSTTDDGEGAYYLINSSDGELELDNELYAELLCNFESNYYDEVTIKSGVQNVSGTDRAKAIYYIATVPKLDKFGNPITLHVVDCEGLKPSQYARKHYSTLTTNASLSFTTSESGGLPTVNGIAIGDGVILNDYSGELPSDYGAYLGIKDNNVIQLYPKTTSAQTMLADGVKQCVFCFGNIVNNGVVNEGAYHVDEGTISMAIGQKSDGTIIIFGNDGRFYDSAGLTVREVANILISEGCVNAWELDGGGSASITYHGTKINQDTDEHRTHERTIAYLFNVQHETKNEQVAKDVSSQGDIERIKNYRLQKQLERYEYRHAYLKGNIGRVDFTTGDPGTTIPFTLSSPSAPTEIPLVYDGGTLYGFKFWRKCVARITYALQIENPTSNDLNIYVDLMNGSSVEYTVSAKIRANSWQPINLNWLSLFYQTYNDTKYIRLRANGGLNSLYINRGTINAEFIPTDDSY